MIPEAAIWQDVEFGSYAADLPLWEELASAAGGPVVELGAGSGRVALVLAGNGHELLAIEHDPALCAELQRRAAAKSLSVNVIEADIAELAGLSPVPRFAVAPLHVLQQVEPERRAAALAGLATLLPTGALLAVVIVDESSLLDGGIGSDQVPDMRDVGGWVYSSEPLWVQVDADALRIRRLRKRVSPAGEIERRVHDDLLHRLSPEELESEARAAGLSPAGRRSIASGPSEADSLVVLLEAS